MPTLEEFLRSAARRSGPQLRLTIDEKILNTDGRLVVTLSPADVCGQELQSRVIGNEFFAEPSDASE